MGTDCKSALTVTGIYPSHLGVGRSVFFLKLYRIFTAVAIILSAHIIIPSAVTIIHSAAAINLSVVAIIHSAVAIILSVVAIILSVVAIIISAHAIILSAVAIIYSAVAIILIVVELYLSFFSFSQTDANVLGLHEVWEKVRLNFRLKTEFFRHKIKF